jgi:hypothetical protein
VTAKELKARQELEESDDEEPYWQRWTSDYDYVYVLFTTGDYANPDPDHLVQIFTGERFVLYRIIRPSNIAVAGDAPAE